MKKEIKDEFGTGKYDEVCDEALRKLKAKGVLLIVIDGVLGHGFSAHLPVFLAQQMPGILRKIANEIEAEMNKSGKN